jgi:hypothetical protein
MKNLLTLQLLRNNIECYFSRNLTLCRVRFAPLIVASRVVYSVRAYKYWEFGRTSSAYAWAMSTEMSSKSDSTVVILDCNWLRKCPIIRYTTALRLGEYVDAMRRHAGTSFQSNPGKNWHGRPLQTTGSTSFCDHNSSSFKAKIARFDESKKVLMDFLGHIFWDSAPLNACPLGCSVL